MFDLTLTGGPYGDASSKYSVRVPTGTLVRDFCRIVAEYGAQQVPKEWGRIYLNDQKICEYGDGLVRIVNEELFGRMSGEAIKKATAHGGWGLMDYSLTT